MDVRLTCKCSMVHRFGSLVRCVKCPCGEVVYGNCEPQVTKQPRTSRLWTEVVGWFRKPEDKGVGDTVQRIAARFGGERFKKFAVKVGMPCGCTDRQREWNELYPYR
jgi:hypothetical protein